MGGRWLIMARSGFGLLESLCFAAGVIALSYAYGTYSSTQAEDTSSAVKEFVLDNGQKCHMDQKSAVVCTDAKGNHQSIDISFDASAHAEKK